MNVFLSFGLFRQPPLSSSISWTTRGSTFATLSVQPKHTWSIKGVGSWRSTPFCRVFHIKFMFCFFPSNFISSTYTDKNNPSFLCPLVLLSWQPRLELSFICKVLCTAAWASGIFKASCTETALCTRPECKLPTYPFSAMWSMCWRFTFPHAPLFSEPDCSSLASTEVTTAWGFPGLSILAMHGKARAVSFSSFRRASATTLKWSLSSVNTS